MILPVSSSKVQLTEKQSYHHGDLRRALIESARNVLSEGGTSKLSLREVARRSGVSHASAYYHFKNKTELVAAVAVVAFEDLAKMTESVSHGDLCHLEQLEALAAAYVRFALENPQEFRLMYLPELRSDAVRTEVEQAGRAGYERLVALIVALQAEGHIARGEPEDIAISAWALMHGLATLMIDGPLYRNARTEEGRGALVANAVKHLLCGILKQ